MSKIKNQVTDSIVALLAAYMEENGEKDKAVDIREGGKTFVLVVKTNGDVHLTEPDGDVLMTIKSGHCNSTTKAIKVITNYIKIKTKRKTGLFIFSPCSFVVMP